MPCRKDTPLSFWDYAKAQGGDFMWKYAEGDITLMRWLAIALQKGTAVIVTDGSYNRTLAPDVSGGGSANYLEDGFTKDQTRPALIGGNFLAL